MGIKIIIAVACLIAGEEIATAAEVGEQVEVSKEDASFLVRSGRALYLNKSDDITKGLQTAQSDDIKRLTALGKANVVAQGKASASGGGDMTSIIAAAVSAGVMEALAATRPQSPSPVAT